MVRRGAGELETEVLGVLWAAGSPMTPTQLVAALDGELAYNTVHTILTRLQDKGLVARVVDGGRRGYAPVKDAAEVAAERMRTALESAIDHAEILQRFVSSLSRDDERTLRAVLGDARPAPGRPAPGGSAPGRPAPGRPASGGSASGGSASGGSASGGSA